ncbi:MAG: lipopolysaccharide biosynthesis protein [Gammaproteobacteria bacterium]
MPESLPVSSPRKRVAQGVYGNVYGTFVATAVQLAGVPILLFAWGAQLYGEWLVLFAIPAYLSLANLGFSHSIANDMTARNANGDREGTLVAFQSLIALNLSIGLAISTLVGVAILNLPMASWLQLSSLSSVQIRWTLLLLSGAVLIQLLEGIPSAGYRATGEYGLGHALSSTIVLFQYLAIWGSALEGLGIVGAAAAFLCVRAAGALTTTGILVRRHPWLKLGFQRAHLAYIRRLLSPSLASLMTPISNSFTSQGVLLVINAFLGPITVVIFSTLQTLSRLSYRLVTIICHSLEPEIASTTGLRNWDLRHRLYLAGLGISMWLSIPSGIALYFFGHAILRAWTHGQVHMNDTLFIWLLASSSISALWFMPFTTLQAMNRHQGAARAYVISGITALMTAWILIRATGHIAEVGLALFVGNGFFALYVLVAAARITQTPLGATLAYVVNPLTLFRSRILFNIPERFMNALHRAFR